VLVAGSQYVEQQLSLHVQLAPADLHSLASLQRFTPSTSTSQCPEQQSEFEAHASFVSLHDDAGTLQVPFTQLSEQQSVFLVQDLWYARHVAQLTPTMHVAPLQQPFVHDAGSHTQAPPTQCWPAEHATPAPHLHAPPPQLSVRFGSHATHAEPPPPHAVIDGVVQVLPEQQPLAHVIEHPAHAPLMH
jgi:hypothetical protein